MDKTKVAACAARWYAKRQQARLDGPKIACACGCGEMIPAVTSNWKPAKFKNGHGGKSARFAEGHAELRRNPLPTGPDHRRWKGGIRQTQKGYVRVRVSHEEAAKWPTAHPKGISYEIARSHKVWNEAHPDDVVQPGYHVHHLNHIRDDDRVENLKKLSADQHNALHWRLRKSG